MVPIGSPSARSIGTPRRLRHAPATAISCRYSGSSSTSGISATARVRIARPETCERLGQVGILGLQLGEQARVLDGNGRLIRERLHQRDLAVREEPDLMSVDGDDTKELVCAQHRDSQHGSYWTDLASPVAIVWITL